MSNYSKCYMLKKLCEENKGILIVLTIGIVASFIVNGVIVPAYAPGGGRAPNIQDGETNYTVWPAKDDGSETTDMMFAVSVNGKYDGYINLSETPVFYSEDPEIGYDGKIITITWWERTYDTNGQIDQNIPVSTRSSDGGLTFEPIVNLDLLPDRPEVSPIAKR